MPRFLFWNLEGKDLQQFVSQLAVEHDVDVMVLAECATPATEMLTSLNAEHARYELSPGLCDHLIFFVGFEASFLTPAFETARVSIRRLTLPARQEILLAAAHLPSRLHFSDESLIFECANLGSLVREQEKLSGHRRTILLGDLNVNPFEAGVVGTGGLHSVMSRQVAARETRTVQARQYEFFFNPMWAHFGDRPGCAPGTYYYDKAEHVTYFWNLFDQVMVRPSLLNGLASDGVRVLTSIGGTSLLDDEGRPNRRLTSDHLPLLAELDF